MGLSENTAQGLHELVPVTYLWPSAPLSEPCSSGAQREGFQGFQRVPVTMCQLRGWTRPEGAGFSDSEGALHPLSSLECPRFQGDGLDLLGAYSSRFQN